MSFENEVKKKLMQNDFAKNNGRIIRTVNVMGGKFVNAHSVCEALGSYMNLCEFDESFIYLHKSCYIEIRLKNGGKIIDDFGKYAYSDVEVALTQKGIKIARGFIVDEAVDI